MRKNGLILGGCSALYLLNCLWLKNAASGCLQWFLTCYFNDILAGAALPAVTSLLLLAAGRPPLKKWLHSALLLLAAGLVWEGLAPLWKSGAVFDWWDFAAYQAGGLICFLINCINFQKNIENQS